VDAPYNLQPVVSGPYRFDLLMVENDVIEGLVLSAFDSYYGEKPFIQQIVFRYFPDAEVAFQAYQQGEIQGISNVPQEVLSEVLGEDDLSVFSARRPELALVLFNLKNPELPCLQEVEVRQALMTGLNRQWMIDHLMNGQGFLADSPLFPGTWAYYDKLVGFEYDPEAAIAALKTAGYQIPAEGGDIRVKDGKPLAFKLLVPDDLAFKTLAEAIQKDWRKLGVDTMLEFLPYDQLISERLDPRLYEAALVSLNLARSADPDPYPFWDQAQAAGGQNYTQWDDKNASEYLEQARITLDLGERARLYRNFQVLFIKELPALPLYYPVYTYAIDRQVQGVQLGSILDPSDRFAAINQWFLVAKRNTEATAEPSAAPTAASQ
jgi:peptide/nickel transport system substrate-binding protein